MQRFLEKIAHTIIPHEKNKNIPHLLQKEFVAVLFVFSFVLFYFNQNNFNIIRGLNLTGAVLPAVLTDLTNQDRALAGVSKLAWSPTLEHAAKLKAEDMIKNSYFAHTSPSGITPWFWLAQAKYNFIYAGENLALDFTESANVETAWLNSPKHRENVLNSRFTDIGIMALDGFFEGRNTTFVVEYFGKPVDFKVAEINPSVKAPETKPKPRTTTAKPVVEGVTTENIKPVNPIKVIEQTDKATQKYISVQNTDATNMTQNEVNLSESQPRSIWYMRLIVNPTNTIKMIYFTILGLVVVAMALMFTKEYQKHHAKHLAMGTLLVVSIVVFMLLISYPVII